MAAKRETVAADGARTDRRHVVDLLDRLLDKGVMATGDLTLGVAGVDLIYVRLSALLCAVDRVMPQAPARRRRSRTRRRSVLRGDQDAAPGKKPARSRRGSKSKAGRDCGRAGDGGGAAEACGARSSGR